jgi:8-hydroxy-5-deazaflavin:NADPH oxidoreductase
MLFSGYITNFLINNTTKMKLAVIGSGRIGKAIGIWAAKAGHEVYFSSRNAGHAREAAQVAGKNSKAGTAAEALEKADLVLFAVPFSVAKDLLTEIGPLLENKVLIDVTNPLKSDFSGLSIGLTTSAAEEIQKMIPKTKVIKAFNTIFSSVFTSQNPMIKGNRISVFYASDDADGKAKIATLITSMGFDAVDAGPLTAARDLEPLALLNVRLGYSLGHGTTIGFSFLR